MLSFPVLPPKNGGCSCSDPTCPNGGKHPAIKGWSELSQSVPIPNGFNMGVLTGVKSGIIVIDEDLPGAADHLHLPETLTISSGRPEKGYHYYFVHPGFYVISKKYWPNVDVKGDGAYVIGPGSVHKSGKVYQIVRGGPAVPLPDNVLAILKSHSHEPGKGIIPTPISKDHPEYPERVQRGIARAKSQEPNGGSNMFQLAIHLIRHLELDIGTAFKIVQEHYNPRCDHPQWGFWSEKEILHKLEDAATHVDTIPGPLDVADIRSAGSGPEPALLTQLPPSPEYSWTPGDTPAGKLRPITVSDIINQFRVHPEWEGVLAWNEFNEQIITKKKPPLKLQAEKDAWTDTDTTNVLTWFEGCGGKCTKSDIWDAVDSVAKMRPFHPIRDWFESLPSSGPGAIQELTQGILGVTDPTCEILIRRFLVGAVKRVFHPGAYHKGMLVLHGEQHIGKSPFVRILFSPWNSENLPDLRNIKEAMRAIVGVWGCEVAELDSILRANPERVKSFLSATSDRFDWKFKRESNHPRQTVFIGTTNEESFLQDVTGDTRFWIIPVPGKIDLDRLESLRLQIWSEAYELFRSGYSNILTPEEETARSIIAKDFRKEDPWTEQILEAMKGRKRVSVKELLLMLGIPRERWERKLSDRVIRVGQYLGVRKPYKGDGQTWMTVPDAIQALSPNTEETARRARVEMQTNLGVN